MVRDVVLRKIKKERIIYIYTSFVFLFLILSSRFFFLDLEPMRNIYIYIYYEISTI